MIEGISKQTIENFNRMSENRKIVLVGLVNENVKKAMSLFDNIECIIDGDTERCGLRYEGLPIYSYEHLYALSPDTHIILVTARTGGVYSVTNAVKEVDTFNIFYLNVIADKFLGFFPMNFIITMIKSEKWKQHCMMTGRRKYIGKW